MMETISLTDYGKTLQTLLARSEVTGGSGSATYSLNEGAGLAVTMLAAVRSQKRKVMVLGNGGSAAIAAHIQNDLGKAAGIKTLAFQDVSTLTAMANDHGYDSAYERCVRQWAEADDLLICISSSGESENMLRGVETARKAGCAVMTFSGFGPANSLRQLGDLNFYVPVKNYGYVETLHAMMNHYLTDMLIEEKPHV